jgi:hypothetical protein
MLTTLHADETLVETQNDQLAPPFFATTGHGVWEPTGRDSYSFTMVQLLFDMNFTGTFVGLLKSRASATLDKAKQRIAARSADRLAAVTVTRQTPAAHRFR